MVGWGWGRRGLATNFQLSPNPLKFQISYSEGSRGFVTNFQLLMLSPNLLKFQIPYMMVGVGGGAVDQLTTFDAESKSTKIPYSLILYINGEGGRRGGGLVANCQLLMLSLNMLKFQIPDTVWGGGVGAGDQLTKGKFKISEPKSQPEISISGEQSQITYEIIIK